MEQNRVLINQAKEAMQYAYVPYSKFQVGAAIETVDGKIYTGCNIENASYGATNCAERTAIFKAASEGVRAIKKVAIVSSSGDITYPCGICRQVIVEFMEDGELIFEDKNGEIVVRSMKDILPFAFNKKDLAVEEDNE